MTLITEKNFIHADAPHDYGRGRKCSQRLSRCLTAKRTGQRGKVRRHAEPVLTGTENRDEIVLCELCRSEWIESGLDPETFIGRKTKQGKATRYKLPNLARVREAERHTRTSLAKDAGVDDGTVKRAEEGGWVGTNPAKKLAKALGVSVGDLR